MAGNFLANQPRKLDATTTYLIGDSAADVLTQAADLLRRASGASFLSIAVTYVPDDDDGHNWRGVLVTE